MSFNVGDGVRFRDTASFERKHWPDMATVKQLHRGGTELTIVFSYAIGYKHVMVEMRVYAKDVRRSYD